MQYLKKGDGALASNTPTTGARSITAASASQPTQNVYFHYYKDDGTTKKALNVFHGLLSQLLKDHKHLRPQFNSQVQKQETDGYHPTSNTSRMKDLLIDLVAMLPQPTFTFLILDALDECLLEDRKYLFDLVAPPPPIRSVLLHTTIPRRRAVESWGEIAIVTKLSTMDLHFRPFSAWEISRIEVYPVLPY